MARRLQGRRRIRSRPYLTLMFCSSFNLHLQNCREGSPAFGLGSHLLRPGRNHRVRRNRRYYRKSRRERVAPITNCPGASSGILDDNKLQWCRQELWRSILLPPRTVRPKTGLRTGGGYIEGILSFSFDSPPFFLECFTSCSGYTHWLCQGWPIMFSGEFCTVLLGFFL